MKDYYQIYRTQNKKNSYLTDDYTEIKKAKGTKKCVIKRRFLVKHYQRCLKTTQPENKINYFEKLDDLKENYQGFINNHNQILEPQ